MPDRAEDFEAIVRAFHEAWQGSDGELAAYWSRYRGTGSLVLLTLLIKVDWQERFHRGERPTAALYFRQFPELTADSDRALSLIYEEFCLLEENNNQPSVSEFCERYEPWKDSLVSQLVYHRELSQVAGLNKPKVRFPIVGDRFATYQLLSVLGQGGAAQVYLAADDLGGRKVVLKVSSSVGHEPSILASLNHRNIVPILTVAESPESGLRGICMPYRPGITLEALLKSFASTALPRKALPVWELLGLSDLNSETTDFGWNDFPVSGTYTEAAAWIGLAIANALAYLHEKEIFHRDIKPANIFLAHQEGPLLFDFNLAHTPLASEHARAALTGGTLPYMAPEQLRAFLDPAVWDQVGASADIYALGLVLRELVTGQKPELPNPQLSLSRAIQDLQERRHALVASTRLIRPEIPPSLDAIISKCLVFQPEERYHAARDLGEDLKRFLKRQPLAVARNSSTLELAINWVYRQRKLTGVLILLGTIGLASSLLQRFTTPRNNEDPLENAPAIREARVVLNSKDSHEFEHARVILQKLHEEYPLSAWPALYLSECYSRLHQFAEAGAWMRIACKQDDAEAAIRQRMTEVTGSANLSVALGEFYRLHARPSEAFATGEKLLATDKKHEGAWNLLAAIRSGQGRHHEAIDYYEQTIASLVSKRRNPSMVGEVRVNLILEMINEIDNLLAPDPSRISQSQAQDLLSRLNDQLTLFDDRGSPNKNKNPLSNRDFELMVSRGAYDSAAGYLSFLEGREEGAATDFEQASAILRQASALAVQDQTPEGVYRAHHSFLARQRSTLANRQRVCGKGVFPGAPRAR